MNVRKNAVIFTVLSFISFGAVSGTVVCSGKIQTLAYHANNSLMVKLDSMNFGVLFCSPDSEWSVSGTNYITGPESCKVMYSTFLAAKMSGKTIKTMYFDGDSVPATCDGWSNWSHANIRYYNFED